MARHVVRHIAVKEDEGFDLAEGERVIDAEFDHPYFHLVVLLEDDGGIEEGADDMPEADQ
jgi:hypothetical protein